MSLKFYSFLILSLMFILSSCDDKPKDLSPSNCIGSDKTESDILYPLMRYMAELPGKSNQISKFDSIFDEHYQAQANKHHILYCYHEKDTSYMLTYRIAPSISEKYVGIGVKIVYNEADSILYYEESFRTWKMPLDLLSMKGKMLLEQLINGKDLKKYYPQNSGEEEWIEFPDEHTWFDVDDRRWKSDLEDVLEPYYQLKNN